MADKWIQLMSEDGENNLYPTSHMDLLWENASPTSDFAAQTVALDLSGYTKVVVIVNYHKDSYSSQSEHGGCGYGFALVGGEQSNVTVYASYGSGGVFSRSFKATISGVEFTQTRYASVGNVGAIPLRIYGIK